MNRAKVNMDQIFSLAFYTHVTEFVRVKFGQEDVCTGNDD
jgi:hypothetical protein